MAAAKQLRFHLTEDALYAANSGRPFTRLGLHSVARAHLSTKSDFPPLETFACPDGELVDAMRAKRLELYALDPNQIRSDYSQQRETEQSYEGRCIWELLQNADDALAPENTSSADLIGAKGLGFKSVLEFTDRPAVFSGPFEFEFDAVKSRPRLLPLDPSAPPLVFHLPHNAQPDAQVAKLKREGFDTVVRLPFRNEAARVEAETRLRELTPYFLLLSQHLASVEIRLSSGSRRTLSRSGATGGDLSDARVRLTVKEDDVADTQDWRLWSRAWAPADEQGKRLSAAIAVPAREDADDKAPELPIHVYFPTREMLGARFLVHAAFKLTENRNSIVRSPHDAALTRAVAELSAEVASALPPLQALWLFADVVSSVQASPKLPARKLQKAIADAVASTRFVPIIGTRDRAAPGETRVWHNDLGPLLPEKNSAVAASRLAAPSMASGFTLLQSVYKARALYSADYASALTHVVCRSVADCRAAIAVAKTACVASAGLPASALDRLAQIKMWPTAAGGFRSLIDATPLVDAADDDWPIWLGSDVLHPELSDAAGEGDLSQSARANWIKLLKGRLLRSRDDRLAYALAPQVAAWGDDEWAKHGWDVLALVRSWLGELNFQKIEPFVPGRAEPSEAVRDKLAHAMRAPYKNTWVPTVDAYASEEINGPDGLAKFIRARSDRFIVGKPKQAREVGSWPGLLRYLGVSWEPKLRKITTWRPEFGRFQRATDMSFRYARPDWRLEFFPECIEDVGSVTVLKMLERLAPVTASLPARWGKVDGADRIHRVPEYGSYAHWQLCSERYLKCRPGIGSSADRLAPQAAYWPEDGLRGITPVIDLHNVDAARRKTLKRLLVGRLGVKDALPSDDETWLEWSKGIARDIESETSRLELRDVRAFYEAALAPERLRTGALKTAPVVCETSKGIRTRPPKSAVWVDTPDLAALDVQAALRDAGLAVFPVQLARGGDRIEAIFGVRRASAVLKLRPAYREPSKVGTEELQRKLRTRRRHLAVTFETKMVRGWSPPKVLGVRGLTLEIASEDRVISTRTVQAHLESDTWLINLDFARWDALARACVGGLPALQAADLRRRVSAVLTAPRDAVLGVLIEDGIPPYRLTDFVMEDENDEDRASAVEFDESEFLPDAPEPESPTDPDASTTATQPPTQNEIRKVPEPSGPAKLAKRPLYGSGAEKGAGRKSKSKAAAAETAERAQQRGMAAEAWFRMQVDQNLPEGWDARFNERDADARESDLVISDGSNRWHIEIKNLTTERLYWSELERLKAADLPGRYFMALLVGTHEIGYHVFWVWNPLHEFGRLERRLDWVWSDTDEGPPLPALEWAPPPGFGFPQKPPTRWNHVIQVTEKGLQAYTHDQSDLQALWKRCRSAGPVDAES